MKGTFKSHSKRIELEEYEKGLDGEDYQRDWYKYSLRSINHEKNLQ